MANKITKKEMFTMIKAQVKDNAEMVAFIDHEIELLDKKASNKKATKTQEANIGIKATILAVLKGAKLILLLKCRVLLLNLASYQIRRCLHLLGS